MYDNLKYINELGGIIAEVIGEDREVYMEPGSDLHAEAEAGLYGNIQEYIAPPPEPRFGSVEEAIDHMSRWTANFIEPVVSWAPQQERISWPSKAEAADAYKAGSATVRQTAMIDAEAQITGENPIDLCNVILAEAQAFEIVTAKVAGLRRKIAAQLRAETDPMNYEQILLAGMQEAKQLAAELGLNL